MKIPAIMLTALSTVLFIIAAWYLPFLIWVCFAPLLYLNARNRWREILPHNIAFSLISACVIFYWSVYFNKETYLLVIALFSSGLFLFFSLSGLFYRISPGPLNPILIAGSWMLMMWLYSFSLFNSYAFNFAIFSPMSAPIIWYIGSHGVTFLIMLMNAMIAYFLWKRTLWMLVPVLLLVIVMSGAFVFSAAGTTEGEPFRVALIQPDIDRSFEWRVNNSGGQVLSTYINMTLIAAESEPDLIVWSEYSLPVDIFRNESLRAKMEELARNADTSLLIGSLKHVDVEESKSTKRYNLAILFGEDGGIAGQKESVRPFPNEGTTPGEKMGLMEVDGKRIGVSLCYEETQLWIARENTGRGAEILVTLSNNQPFTQSYRGLELTSRYSRLSAAENERYVLRSANTGRTEIINPYGKIVAYMRPNEPGILVHEILI